MNWENDGAELLNMKGNGYKVGSTNHNLEHIFKPALSWTKITTGPVSFRSTGYGFLFDDASGLCPIHDTSKQAHLAALLNSPVVYSALGALNPTLNVNPGNLADIPVLLPEAAGAMADGCIALAASDWDSYETSWDFTRLPLLAPEHRTGSLAASFESLRAQWQEMTNEMQRLEDENNRIFIDAYGLQDELNPEVPLEQITLTCNPAYSIGGDKTDAEREDALRVRTMTEFLSYAVGCMFGRYRVVKMSLPAIYLQHRVQPLDRQASALFQMMKLHYPGAADPVDLESVSQAQVEEKRAAVLVGGDRSYSDQSEQIVIKRWAT